MRRDQGINVKIGFAFKKTKYMTTNERREKIMRILYAKGHCTTSELAENFGVSERTVRRDIGLLSLSKPIYTKSGKNGGGIYIVEGYRIDRNYFSTEEENLLKKVAEIAKRYGCLLTEEEKDFLDKTLSYHSKPKKGA